MANTNVTRKEMERLYKGRKITAEERDQEQGDGNAGGAGIARKGFGQMNTVNKGEDR